MALKLWKVQDNNSGTNKPKYEGFLVDVRDADNASSVQTLIDNQEGNGNFSVHSEVTEFKTLGGGIRVPNGGRI